MKKKLEIFMIKCNSLFSGCGVRKRKTHTLNKIFGKNCTQIGRIFEICKFRIRILGFRKFYWSQKDRTPEIFEIKKIYIEKRLKQQNRFKKKHTKRSIFWNHLEHLFLEIIVVRLFDKKKNNWHLRCGLNIFHFSVKPFSWQNIALWPKHLENLLITLCSRELLPGISGFIYWKVDCSLI